MGADGVVAPCVCEVVIGLKGTGRGEEVLELGGDTCAVVLAENRKVK